MKPNINVNEFKAEIIRNGFTNATFAEAMELSPSGLWRKMRGENDFTLGDMRKAKQILHLSDEVFKSIFLI